MAERIERKQVTIPAGTAIAAPITQALTFNRGEVQRLEVDVPPGPSGVMGFMIGHSGGIVVPYDGSTWLVLDDAHKDWSLEGYPTGSAWFLRGYNTGLYPHTVYMTFHIRETRLNEATNVALVPIVPLAPQVVTE